MLEKQGRGLVGMIRRIWGLENDEDAHMAIGSLADAGIGEAEE